MTVVVLARVGNYLHGRRDPLVADAVAEGDRIVIRRPGRLLPTANITPALWRALVDRGYLSGIEPRREGACPQSQSQ